MERIYICGDMPTTKKEKTDPITGKAGARLRSMGYSVAAPEKMGRPLPGWASAIQERIRQIKESDAVYALPQWQEDVVSRIELAVAIDLGLPIIYHPATRREIREALTLTLGN